MQAVAHQSMGLGLVSRHVSLRRAARPGRTRPGRTRQFATDAAVRTEPARAPACAEASIQAREVSMTSAAQLP